MDAWNGQRDADKGGNSEGGSKGLKGSGKGGKGKGLYEVGWSMPRPADNFLQNRKLLTPRHSPSNGPATQHPT